MAEYQKAKKPQIYLNKNYRKEVGDNQPMFNGNVTFPGDADTKRHLAAWLNNPKAKDGAARDGEQHATISIKLMRSGDDQLREHTHPEEFKNRGKTYTLPAKDGGKALEILPETGVAFVNKSRDAEHPTRSHYYGYINPGQDKPLMRIGLWQDLDRQGQVMLSGPVEIYDPNREKEQNEASPPPEVGRQERELESMDR